MKGDELHIDGKRYVSSSAAAELNGYTKDYVGQLARAGKITAKLIGRSWYIEEESLLDHKGSVRYTLTRSKKPRNKVSRATEKSIPDIENSDKQLVKEKATSEDLSTEQATPMDVAINSTVITKPSMLSTRPYAKNDVLVNSDIEYESGEALFYEDDRPVLPEPVRIERFDNVPILKPTRRVPGKIESTELLTPDIKKIDRIASKKRDIVTRSVPVVDGVRVHRKKNFRHQNPGKVSDTQIRKQPNIADRSEELATTNQPSTKAIPVLGSLALFLLFLLWFVFVR